MIHTNTLNHSNFNPMDKYPDGYIPKIAYHMTQGNVDKVEYFWKKQTETYGHITSEQCYKIYQLVTA